MKPGNEVWYATEYEVRKSRILSIVTTEDRYGKFVDVILRTGDRYSIDFVFKTEAEARKYMEVLRG